MPAVTVLTIFDRKMLVVIRVVTDITAREHRFTIRRVGSMTTDTRLLFVGGAKLFQLPGRRLMTGGTNRARLSRLFFNHLWEMRRMTLQTLQLGHFRQMRAMAFLALHLAAVLAGMTFTTIKFAVFIGIELGQTLLVIMAGNAGWP